MTVDNHAGVTNWSIRALGDVADIVLGGTPSTEVRSYWGGSIPWMASGEVNKKRVTEADGRITEAGLAASNATLVDPPTVAIGLAGQGKTRGTAALVTTRLCTNQSIALIKGHGDLIDSAYLFHNLDSRYDELRARSAGGGRAGLSKEILAKVPVPLPEFREQSRIAAVLDAADHAIAKTEAVIAKLRQVRTGVIHDLLTFGLDENGHLRDPIAQPDQFHRTPLGVIPREWDICQLCDTIERVYDYRGRTPLKIGMDWGGGDIPALSANNVEMGQVNFSKVAHLGSPALHARWMTQGDTEEGDILMTMEAPLGNIAQLPDNKRYILSQRVILLRPKPQRFTKDYLALQLVGPRFQKEIVRQSSGSTAVGIQRAKLELIQVAVPRRKQEQESATRIVRLNNKQIRQHESELAKLQSIKSGLMDDLFTGRVRVPEATP